ncbi:SPOR domain-containing protein [Pontibacter chitinilyticus]|uniref:HU domain-containing protein n=1 Tax=Pontibacter chitinilyticus TaxID=2674989 RepID=UPI0032197357
MVEQHIKSLLYEQDCVIIPDFGGLITRYVSARINPVKHTFSPPSKKIAFNEKLTLNDGLLISTIAYQQGISLEEAQRIVADFVFQARRQLDVAQRFELQDIGVFRYNAERRLEFEYVEGDNMLEDSFGLPEIMARPIRLEEPAILRTLLKEREPVQVNSSMPFRRKLKRFYNVAAGLALAGLTGTGLYYLSLQTDYNVSSLNPIASLIGNYTFANVGPGMRYTSDYVPFTADERQQAYAAILPVIPVTEVAAEQEDWQATADSASTTTITLNKEVEQSVNEEVNPVETVVSTGKAEEPELTISHKTGRYYIITGGFSTLANAEVSREALRKGGQEAKVLLPGPGSKLYRVSVGDYEDQTEAQTALLTFRKKYGETLWVLTY